MSVTFHTDNSYLIVFKQILIKYGNEKLNVFLGPMLSRCEMGITSVMSARRG